MTYFDTMPLLFQCPLPIGHFVVLGNRVTPTCSIGPRFTSVQAYSLRPAIHPLCLTLFVRACTPGWAAALPRPTLWGRSSIYFATTMPKRKWTIRHEDFPPPVCRFRAGWTRCVCSARFDASNSCGLGKAIYHHLR